ncbi:hypothetical protein RRG08_041550 [Elysia crispata]|uniref:Uncharacterized protein n=1 Tax=Elysia crispata TaxID=231223 RepID=A0AAE0ZUW4_9GAST|nr:hypothetical protein RRG08_041550 [Elysia crispata]
MAHLLLLFSLAWVSSLVVPSSSVLCPFLCTCNGDNVVCAGITSLSGLLFPESTRKIHIIGASLHLIGPSVFGNQTEHVTFQACKIGDIQPLAFSNLHNLKTLTFQASRIDRILPCGIHSISNAESISFASSEVKEIKAGGLSDITGVTNLTISSSYITTVESFGFHIVQAEVISIEDSSVDLIKTAAFSDVYDVKSLVLSGISLISIEAGAFYRIRDLKSVQISGFFRGLRHNSLMELREATPGDHEGFRFHTSRVACNCASAPLLDYVQQNPTAADRSVICSVIDRPLRAVKPEKLCPGYSRETYCTNVTLTPPTCSLAVTNTSSPIINTSYTERICPTKSKRVVQETSSEQKNKGVNRGAETFTANGLLLAFLAFSARTI